MLISGGTVMKSTTLWSGTPATFQGWPTNSSFGSRWASYGAIYRSQLWVAVLVNKLAKAKARLPLKVYERTGDGGRVEVRDHPYAELLRHPNVRWSSYFTWLWTSSMYDVYGEAFLGKIRDPGGRPTQLVPLHPTCMHEEKTEDGRTFWTFQNGNVRVEGIPDWDLLHPRTFNPDSFTRGMSPLEPLRRSLENEDAARRATTAFWKNSARPGVLLKHPTKISKPAADRLKLQWNDITGGVDKTGSTVILEEGMQPERWMLTAEEAQYIESHKMHTEEACAIYDVPPPVVHILDHATYSNITEQMRSMYRDTMGPRLKAFEAELEMQVRGSVRPGTNEPDFGAEVYAEFLLDEVLRGDFEARADAKMKAINSGQMTPAEAREMENLPFIEGSDRLYINSTMVPLADGTGFDPKLADAVGSLVRSGFDPASILAELGLPSIAHLGLLPITLQKKEQFTADLNAAQAAIDTPAARALMGRLSRQKTLEEIDPDALVEGLNGAGPVVVRLFEGAKAAGANVAEFRNLLRVLFVKEEA
jgi:HK97 family phage portal protein